MVVGVAGPFHHNLGRDAAGEGESIYSEGSIPDEPKACSGSQGIEEHHCLCQSQRVRRDSGMYPFLLPVGVPGRTISAGFCLMQGCLI